MTEGPKQVNMYGIRYFINGDLSDPYVKKLMVQARNDLRGMKDRNINDIDHIWMNKPKAYKIDSQFGIDSVYIDVPTFGEKIKRKVVLEEKKEKKDLNVYLTPAFEAYDSDWNQIGYVICSPGTWNAPYTLIVTDNVIPPDEDGVALAIAREAGVTVDPFYFPSWKDMWSRYWDVDPDDKPYEGILENKDVYTGYPVSGIYGGDIRVNLFEIASTFEEVFREMWDIEGFAYPEEVITQVGEWAGGDYLLSIVFQNQDAYGEDLDHCSCGDVCRSLRDMSGIYTLNDSFTSYLVFTGADDPISTTYFDGYSVDQQENRTDYIPMVHWLANCFGVGADWDDRFAEHKALHMHWYAETVEPGCPPNGTLTHPEAHAWGDAIAQDHVSISFEHSGIAYGTKSETYLSWNSYWANAYDINKYSCFFLERLWTNDYSVETTFHHMPDYGYQPYITPLPYPQADYPEYWDWYQTTESSSINLNIYKYWIAINGDKVLWKESLPIEDAWDGNWEWHVQDMYIRYFELDKTGDNFWVLLAIHNRPQDEDLGINRWIYHIYKSSSLELSEPVMFDNLQYSGPPEYYTHEIPNLVAPNSGPVYARGTFRLFQVTEDDEKIKITTKKCEYEI